MSTQSEAALEDNLIKTLVDGGYHLVSINDEKIWNLILNNN